MAKYEIMLVVNGSLEESAAKEAVSELINLIKPSENFEEKELGLRDLAYEINKQTKGWYFQYNFETSDSPVLAEFRRLTLINKSVLRHLVINLEKDYGYRAINNPKKVNKSEQKLKKYTERQARMKVEREARDAAMGEYASMREFKKEPR